MAFNYLPARDESYGLVINLDEYKEIALPYPTVVKRNIPLSPKRLTVTHAALT